MIFVLQEFDLAARWTSMIQDLYAEAVHNLAQKWPDEQSLEVSYRDIEGFDDEFAQNIIAHPDLHFQAANQALRQFLQDEGHTSMYPFVRIVHLPSDQIRTVSQLRADDIGMMLAIDAIATKISGVRPRIYSASFMCSSCGHITEVKQPNEQELIEPLECSQIDGGCGRQKRQTRFVLQEDDSILINSQFIELQESPEQLKGGIQPERIICIGEHDIAGKLNPGDRVKANGVLFIRSQRKGGKDTPVFDIFLRIHSLERQNVPLEEILITEDEELEIKELASRSDIYDLFSKSIAPSIFGMDRVKESLMLQLFGGVARLNPDGTRNRGDIHILLMGDPGVAKSQLLDYMSKISPRGQFTSGQSASAAGLTAAAVQDSAADGRWTLEAGALVLADLGLASIDEFDKMNEADRSSMHEAMEQQTISISKAGINASLRTRCAVLAAANPKNGRFEPISDTPFTAQINLAPPLISRFDIIWLLTDNAEKDRDSKIAQHIINNRLLGTSELLVNQGSAPDPSRKLSSSTQKSQDGDEILTKALIRKYIAYSKRAIHPKLDENARNRIVEFYVETRKKGGESSDSVSITARSLEAVARMAEASARIRLSEIANIEDVDRAIRLTRTWRNELMGDNFDETTLQTGRKASARNHERILLDTIRDLESRSQESIKYANRIDIYNEMQNHNVDRAKVDNMIEKMVRDGTLMLPRGYDTIQTLR